jgi:hypothetical protein
MMRLRHRLMLWPRAAIVWWISYLVQADRRRKHRRLRRRRHSTQGHPLLIDPSHRWCPRLLSWATIFISPAPAQGQPRRSRPQRRHLPLRRDRGDHERRVGDDPRRGARRRRRVYVSSRNLTVVAIRPKPQAGARGGALRAVSNGNFLPRTVVASARAGSPWLTTRPRNARRRRARGGARRGRQTPALGRGSSRRKHLYAVRQAGDDVKIFQMPSGGVWRSIREELTRPVPRPPRRHLYIGAAGTGSILASTSQKAARQARRVESTAARAPSALRDRTKATYVAERKRDASSKATRGKQRGTFIRTFRHAGILVYAEWGASAEMI